MTVTFSISDIIRIILTILQICLYLIIFFKLHKLKGNKPASITELLKKGGELFNKYIGTLDINKILSLKDKQNKEPDNEDK